MIASVEAAPAPTYLWCLPEPGILASPVAGCEEGRVRAGGYACDDLVVPGDVAATRSMLEAGSRGWRGARVRHHRGSFCFVEWCGGAETRLAAADGIGRQFLDKEKEPRWGIAEREVERSRGGVKTEKVKKTDRAGEGRATGGGWSHGFTYQVVFSFSFFLGVEIYCFAIVHLENAPTLVATRSCPVATGAHSGCNLFTSGCN
jgi:hypothetical protein